MCLLVLEMAVMRCSDFTLSTP